MLCQTSFLLSHQPFLFFQFILVLRASCQLCKLALDSSSLFTIMFCSFRSFSPSLSDLNQVSYVVGYSIYIYHIADHKNPLLNNGKIKCDLSSYKCKNVLSHMFNIPLFTAFHFNPRRFNLLYLHEITLKWRHQGCFLLIVLPKSTVNPLICSLTFGYHKWQFFTSVLLLQFSLFYYNSLSDTKLSALISAVFRMCTNTVKRGH